MKHFQRFLTFLLCLALTAGGLTVWGLENTSYETAIKIDTNNGSYEFYSSTRYQEGTTYYYFNVVGRGKMKIDVSVTKTNGNSGASYGHFHIYNSDKALINNTGFSVSSLKVGSTKYYSITQELTTGTYYFVVECHNDGQTVNKMKISTSFECSHESTSDTVTRKPTCSAVGEQVTTCRDCSEKIRVTELEKLPHTLPDEWETTREATCAKEGERIKKCTVCGETAETEVIEKPDHTFGEWEISRETTCAAAGERKRVCSACSFAETEPIAALAHTFGDWKITKSPTCTLVGERQRTCSVCNYTDKEEVEKLAHKFGKWETTEKSTCTKKGERVRTCSVCSEEQKEDLPLDDHTYGAWTILTEPSCRNTGKRERTCSVCREKQTEELPMTSHDYGSWYTSSKATEQSAGSEYRTCADCGKKDTRTLPRLVHGAEYEWKITKSPTCTENGTRTKYCSYCEKAVTTETLPKSSHNFGAWTTVTAAQYKKDGTEKRTCQKCDAAETRNVSYVLPGKAAFRSQRGYEAFHDVAEDAWFYRYVKTAYEYKLANGVGNSAFSPDSKFTVAQVLTVAANIHSAYYGTTIGSALVSEPWYMPYVRYCLEQKLITSNQFDDYTRSITRGEMAIVFASLLPDEEYTAVVSGQNPDVTSDLPCYTAVNKLYKAGIVGGDAGSGKFRPDDEIKRSEACVIFTRIAAPEYRIGKA